MTNTSVYERGVRPAQCGGGPTHVEVQLKLTQLNAVDQRLGTIEIGGYFRMWWKDPRLAYNASQYGPAINLQGAAAYGLLWRPNLYVENLVEKDVTAKASLAQLYPDGSIWVSEQTVMTVKCGMSFGRLPFDRQRCNLVVASYSEDITQVRLTAKGGQIGASEGGVGIVGAPMSSGVWHLGEDGEKTETEGFETIAKAKVFENWDYVTLEWTFARKPDYFIRQVLVPDVLFLGVSYTGFFVDCKAAPARAALAVMPLLIQITLINTVYNSLPKTSERLWLSDWLLVSLFFCSLSAAEFGLVQFCVMKETRDAQNLEKLRAIEKEALRLTEQAHSQGRTLLQLLHDYQVEEVKDTVLSTCEDNEPRTGRRMSEAAKKDGITEANLSIISYVRDLFERYDKDESNHLSCSEIRKVLAYFNIYVSAEDVSKMLCMFLRDTGETTPGKEMEATARFSQFARFLIVIDQYLLKASNRVTPTSLFTSVNPSRRCDIIMRWCFPAAVVLKLIVMMAIVPTY